MYDTMLEGNTDNKKNNGVTVGKGKTSSVSVGIVGSEKC